MKNKQINFLLSVFFGLICQYTNCQETHKVSLNNQVKIYELLNEWHHAATVADEVSFFERMDETCIYIGTDSSERWTKTEFFEWSKNTFEWDTAWDFKPFDRRIIISEDGKYAWFDELLDTWMGICRGSGVLVKDTHDNWKIIHYHLSVTVPNEKIMDFVSLINK
ncbi:nuclear transport factor 2 family protein [candidate division KSB1 bacterium]